MDEEEEITPIEDMLDKETDLQFYIYLSNQTGGKKIAEE
jgi:hypothetical protein